MENLSTVLHYYPIHSEATQTHGFYPVGPQYSSKLDDENYDSVPYYTQVEDEDDIKRPMNSFLLWAKIMRRKYANENPNLHNAEISKLLGKIWNSMTTLEKRPFVERAEKLRIIHMRTYPNYRYAPKKRKDKKSHRTISPEVAAALHSTLFDVKNIISGQLSQKSAIGDLKSYGYLRKAFENNKTAEQVDKKQYNNSERSLDSKDETCVQGDEVNNVERMTLHYYPKQGINETKPKQNTNVISNVLRMESTEQSKVERIARWCADTVKSKETERLSHMSDCIEDERWKTIGTLDVEGKRTENCENIELYYSSDELSQMDNDLHYSSTDDSIDDDIPDFLQSLINSPLHFNNSMATDNMSLWSDIGDIISAGTIK